MAPIITLRKADLRDPRHSKQIGIHFEGHAECKSVHCCRPEIEIDPEDLAEIIAALAEYLGVSQEEARRRFLDNAPRSEVPSYHGHIIISGPDPEASPRYFAVLSC